MTAAHLDRERLVKLCGMLGSNHAGERANAAAAADRLIREAGLRWPDVILPALPGPTTPQAYCVTQAVQFLLDRWDLLSDWEISFCEGIQRQRSPLSPKQREVLDRLVAKCRVEAAA
jgi:hypothetical protein